MDFADGMGGVSGRVHTKGVRWDLRCPFCKRPGSGRSGRRSRGLVTPSLTPPVLFYNRPRRGCYRVWGTGCLNCGARSKAGRRGDAPGFWLVGRLGDVNPAVRWQRAARCRSLDRRRRRRGRRWQRGIGFFWVNPGVLGRRRRRGEEAIGLGR